KVDLLVSLHDAGGALSGVIEYASDALDRAAAERMAGHLAVLADDLARRPQGRVREAPLLTPEERTTLLVTWNETARGQPSPRYFTIPSQALATPAPRAIAARSGEDVLTYAALNRAANRSARRLVDLGGRPGALVAVHARRSPALVAALLGVLKAGAAYVPI